MNIDKIIDNINIVYEDNHILIVVKPHNMPVCEDATGDLDLLRVLKEYLVRKHDKPGNAFLGLVHRLDRPTGGVMVFAKTSKAASRLSQSLQQGEVDRKYLVVLDGVPQEKQNELTHYLLKNEAKNEVVTAPMATVGAKKAILDYHVLEVKDKYALASINLQTGRAHQIRVQMAAIGTPVLFDRKYGKPLPASRTSMALWAVEIKFPHPISREVMTFRVFPADDKIPWKYFNISLYLNVNIKYN